MKHGGIRETVGAGKLTGLFNCLYAGIAVNLIGVDARRRIVYISEAAAVALRLKQPAEWYGRLFSAFFRRLPRNKGETGVLRGVINGVTVCFPEYRRTSGSAGIFRRYPGYAFAWAIFTLESRTDDTLASGIVSGVLPAAVVNYIPCQVFVKDPACDFRYVVANRNFLNYYHLEAGAVIGKTDFEIFTTAVAEELRRNDLQVCAHPGKIFHFAEDIPSRHDRREFFKSLKVAITDSDGKTRLLGVCVDATDLVKSKLQYGDLDALLNEMLEEIPNFVFAKDADDDYRYVLANPSYLRCLNRNANELIGRNDFDLFAPEMARKYREDDLWVVEHGARLEIDEMLPLPNGGKMYIITNKTMVTRHDGHRILIGVATDATRRRELEQRQKELITKQNRLIEYEKATNTLLEAVALATDFRSAVNKILRTIGAMLKAESCSVMSYGDDCRTVRPLFHWQSGRRMLRPFRKNYDVAGQPWTQWLLDKKDIMIEDVLEIAPELDDAVARGMDFRANLSCGIWMDGTLWGVAVINFDEPRKFSETDISLLHNTGNLFKLAYQLEERNRKLDENIALRRQILDNISLPMQLVDTDYNAIFANSACLRYWNLPEGTDITGQQCRDVFCRGRFPNGICCIEQISKTGERYTTRIKHCDGTDHVMLVEPMHDHVGRLRYIMASMIDVTEQTQLTENEKVTKACLEVLVKQDDAREAIRQVLKLIGLHLQADHVYVLYFDDSAGCFCNHEAYVRDGGEPVFGELKVAFTPDDPWYGILEKRELLLCPDMAASEARQVMGSCMPFYRRKNIESCYGGPVFVNDRLWGDLEIGYVGRPVSLTSVQLNFLRAAIHVIELLIEKSFSRERLLQALSDARIAAKAKSIFLATMSHEIRTPLNAVIGFSELLQRPELSGAEHLEYLQAIHSGGNALLRLINDILDLSKLEAEQVKIIPQRSDLKKLGEELRLIFAAQTRAKALDFAITWPEDLPELYLDVPRLRQVLFNIIGNAVKFTFSGRIAVDVEFTRTDGQYGRLAIKVKDTGIGIPLEFQSRLFDPFARAEDDVRGERALKGTGLGMAICKRLVECMRGELAFESRPGEGSCFVVTLPQVGYAPSAGGEPEPEVPAMPHGHYRMLLIDDVRMNLRVLEALLKPFMLEWRMAESGDRALEILKEFKPDIIFTDIWMPRMNGVEFAEHVRTDPAMPGVALYAITADAENDRNFDLKFFDGVLLKPVSGAKLGAVLYEWERKASGTKCD